MNNTEQLQKHKFDLTQRLQQLDIRDEALEIEIATYDLLTETIEQRVFRIISDVYRRHNNKRPNEPGYTPTEFDRIVRRSAKAGYRAAKNNTANTEDEAANIVLGSDETHLKREQFNRERILESFHYSGEFGHKPAYIIILNYNPEEHGKGIIDANYSHPLVEQKSRIHELNEEQKSLFTEIAYQDGAIIANMHGQILATNAELAYDPTSFATNSHLERRNLNQILGFSEEVHTRHHAAIDATRRMLGTVAYVLGEKEGQNVQQDIRTFYLGKIRSSTIPLEHQLYFSKQ